MNRAVGASPTTDQGGDPSHGPSRGGNQPAGQDRWLRGAARGRWLVYVSEKGMTGMRLEDQIHIFRDENRGQKSKQQQPQIPRTCSHSVLRSRGQPFLPQRTVIAVTPRASQHVREARERSLCVFRGSWICTIPDSSVCWEGAGLAGAKAATALRNSPPAKK